MFNILQIFSLLQFSAVNIVVMTINIQWSVGFLWWKNTKGRHLETRGQNVNSRSEEEINMVKFFTEIVHRGMSNSVNINEYVTLSFTFLGSFEGHYLTHRSLKLYNMHWYQRTQTQKKWSENDCQSKEVLLFLNICDLCGILCIIKGCNPYTTA